MSTSALILSTEENILAIFKARFSVMNPLNRWYPVLQRYIGLVSARIDGLGGNASAVPASFDGIPRPSGGEELCGHEAKWVGKVCGLIFDHFGDFEGFILKTEMSEHRFATRERDVRVLVERAWRERLLITVEGNAEQPHFIRRVIVLKPPEPFCG